MIGRSPSLIRHIGAGLPNFVGHANAGLRDPSGRVDNQRRFVAEFLRMVLTWRSLARSATAGQGLSPGLENAPRSNKRAYLVVSDRRARLPNRGP
jgi:hypothetical protein